MEIVTYKERAKNVVFIFGDDLMPDVQDVYKVAFEPQRGVVMYRVVSHQETITIFTATPTAFEHFVTKSAPVETLKFLEPTVLGVTEPFYLYG